MNDTIIVDGDAVLRPLEEGDLPTTLAWRNHPESRVWFHTTEVIEPDQHSDWFRRNRDRDDDLVFLLDLDGVPVAQVALYGIHDGSAEFGRMLVDPGQRGRGVSHRALDLCLRMAAQLGITDLHLEVKPDNARAIAAYRRAGFRNDGTAEDGSLVMRRTAP